MKTMIAICLFLFPGRVLADILQPMGLEPGDEYRIAFVTEGVTDAFDTDIEYYNTFVREEAERGTETSKLKGVEWMVIGSTADVSARENTATLGSAGVPIFLTDGSLFAANYRELYEPHPLRPGLERDQNGDRSLHEWAYTGTNYDGFQDGVIVLGFDGTEIAGGRINSTFQWLNAVHLYPGTQSSPNEYPVYALSTVTHVASVPEPSLPFYLSLISLGCVAHRGRTRSLACPAPEATQCQAILIRHILGIS